jgi:PilZ domain
MLAFAPAKRDKASRGSRSGTLANDEEKATDYNEDRFSSREFERGAVTIPAEIREAGGGRQRISVIDLSRSGFRMHCVFLILPDRHVFLTMPGFESMEARIAWHEDDYYGCQFRQRLHEAIYEHVIRTYPSLGGRLV